MGVHIPCIWGYMKQGKGVGEWDRVGTAGVEGKQKQGHDLLHILLQILLHEDPQRWDTGTVWG